MLRSNCHYRGESANYPAPVVMPVYVSNGSVRGSVKLSCASVIRFLLRCFAVSGCRCRRVRAAIINNACDADARELRDSPAVI